MAHDRNCETLLKENRMPDDVSEAERARWPQGFPCGTGGSAAPAASDRLRARRSDSSLYLPRPSSERLRKLPYEKPCGRAKPSTSEEFLAAPHFIRTGEVWDCPRFCRKQNRWAGEFRTIGRHTAFLSDTCSILCSILNVHD